MVALKNDDYIKDNITEKEVMKNILKITYLTIQNYI